MLQDIHLTVYLSSRRARRRQNESTQLWVLLRATKMEQPAEKHFSIPNLPEDIFLHILDGLDPWDVCRCRRVARAWKDVFEKDEYLSIALRKYPRSREVRKLTQSATSPLGYWSNIEKPSISETFKKVASLYYHLTHGKARSIDKYKLFASEQFSSWFPIAQWEYHESQPGGRLYYENATHISRLGRKPFLFRPTFWSYDDGLVVFPPGDLSVEERTRNWRWTANVTDLALVLLDLRNTSFHPIPFDVEKKVIRNLRLKDRTLIIEWAEKQPFHALNDTEQVHRHFATCFDLQSHMCLDGDEHLTYWEVKFRNEWKIHFLGLPLTHRDRFFSTHNAGHYAIYFWQPNRSMYTGDEERPIESLFVWDISNASSYRPSADPTGRYATGQAGPSMIKRLVLDQLDYYGIRQHSDVALMSLHLDSINHTLTVRENVCVAGQGYFDPAERLSCAKTTTLLFKDFQGPYLYREWDRNLPPYRGHCSMESADIEEPEKWFLPIMDVMDETADVRFSVVQTCFTSQSIENTRVMRVKVNGITATMEQVLVEQVAALGKIAGDERWLIGQNHSLELVVLKF